MSGNESAIAMKRTLDRWVRAKGRGGYPTAIERYHMAKVLERHDALSASAPAMHAALEGLLDATKVDDPARFLDAIDQAEAALALSHPLEEKS